MGKNNWQENIGSKEIDGIEKRKIIKVKISKLIKEWNGWTGRGISLN